MILRLSYDYRPEKILSENSKTGVSVNLPIVGHCRPSTLCQEKCYARRGHVAFPAPRRKQRWVSHYLAQSNVSDLITECRNYQAVRLCGTGDLKNEHIPQILNLAHECSTTHFWGMTRKPEIAEMLNFQLPNLKMMVSIDRSSPEKPKHYQGPLCWGPRMPEDTVPDESRIITVFPCHMGGRVVKGMPRHQKDCPGVWHEVSGCNECSHCWTYNFKKGEI